MIPDFISCERENSLLPSFLLLQMDIHWSRGHLWPTNVWLHPIGWISFYLTKFYAIVLLCNAEILEKILHETVSVVLYSCQFLWCPQGASFVTYVRWAFPITRLITAWAFLEGISTARASECFTSFNNESLWCTHPILQMKIYDTAFLSLLPASLTKGTWCGACRKALRKVFSFIKGKRLTKAGYRSFPTLEFYDESTSYLDPR